MSRTRRFFLPFAFAFLSALACSSSDDASAPPATPSARFVLSKGDPPGLFEVPFPSDVYKSGATIREDIPLFDREIKSSGRFLTHELAKGDGFSRDALAIFWIDDPTAETDDDGGPGSADVDPASLPRTETDCASDTSATYLIDLAATDPAAARVPCRAQWHTDGTLSKDRPMLAIGPARGFVLEPGHSYAAVLTSRAKDTKGHAIGASEDFDEITSATPVYGPALDKVKNLLAPALAGDKAKVVAIAPYTTSNGVNDLFATRDAREAAAAPKLAWTDADLAPMGAAKFAQKPTGGALPAGFAASLDDWLGVVAPAAKLPDGSDDTDTGLPVRAHDKIAAVGTAAFDAPNYLQEKGGYSTLDHHTVLRDPQTGAFTPPPEKPTSKIWVTFAIPTAPMPPGGYPVVISQHGLSGSRGDMLNTANAFCAHGWMVAAIDSVTFGARAPEPRYQTDAHTDWESAPGATYKGPDGIADVDGSGGRNGSFDFFGGLQNIGALRDQLRQAALDTTELVKVLRSSPDLAPLTTGAGGAPKIDPDRIAYVGNSLGGIEGALAASIEPHVAAWVLNVAGGGVVLELATHAPSISVQLAAAASLNFGLQNDKLDESHPLVTFIQTVIDSGDPIDYARTLVTAPHALAGAPTKPRNVLQIEVVYDELVSNESNEALARAGGWGLATPNVGSNAGVSDVKNVAGSAGRVPLPDVAPAGDGTIHDTPVPGVTAVVVQTSPSQHGEDMEKAKSRRRFAVPYGRFDTEVPFPQLDPTKEYTVRTSYRQVQATMTGFIDDAFQGKVPRVAGFQPPVRDVDDDGAPDDVDPDPNDPTVH